MAFRALLFSTSSDTNATMAAACNRAAIRPEVCPDIFTAIDKGKTRAFSCLIVDWADQPEAGFLLKRARESAVNRDTLALAIVDREPTPAEIRDSKLVFLIYRPVSDKEADAVLAKACEQMQPVSAEEDTTESSADDDAASAGSSVVSAGADEPDYGQQDQPAKRVQRLVERCMLQE